MLSQTIGLLLPTSFILGGLMATGVRPRHRFRTGAHGRRQRDPRPGDRHCVCMIFGMLGMIVAAYLMLALTLAPALEQICGPEHAGDPHVHRLLRHARRHHTAGRAGGVPGVPHQRFRPASDQRARGAARHRALFCADFFLFEPALILQGAAAPDGDLGDLQHTGGRWSLPARPRAA